MLLLQAEGGAVEVGKRGRPHATWMTAMGFVAMAALPFFGAGSMTAARWATTFALLLLAAALFAFARRPRSSVQIRVEGDKILIDGKSASKADAELALETGQLAVGTPRSRYRVCLRLPSAAPVVLLEGRAPDRVLTDLRHVVRELDLRVVSGWGLPSAAEPWKVSQSDRSPPERMLALQPYQRQRRVSFTVALGTIGMAVAMALMVSARLDRGQTVGNGSYTLGALTLLIALMIAVGVGSDRRVATLGSFGVEIERRMFGVRLSRRTIDARGWVGAYRVHTSEEELVHLLLDFGDRVVSVPCAGESEEAVAALLEAPRTSG
jgi:hypothetical protein